MKFKPSYFILLFASFGALGAGFFFYDNLFKKSPLHFESTSLSSQSQEAKGFKNVLTLKTLDQLDTSKPTVCNITINSDDEKQVFNSFLKKDFNIVELIDEDNEEWFEDTCRSGLKCDILVVSGHFGGSFFGRSRHRLPATKIENMSCQSECSGLLKNPKEVFLFGCNTTAGKEPDSRTPHEYAEILYNDHRDVYRTRELAELHAAIRYSPVGTQTQDKMKRAFPNAKIYGFSSVAPSGGNIEGQLKKYFKKIPDYKTSFQSKEGHVRIWNQLMRPHYNIRTVEGVGSIENPICILGSQKPILDKLSWVRSVFKSQNGVLTYAPNIHEYFKTLDKRFGGDWEKWPKAEVSYMEALQNSLESKKTVETFLRAPLEGLLTVQMDVLELGSKVGWFNKEERKRIQVHLVGDLFKNNLTLEDKDLICSLEVELELDMSDLPKEKWNRYTIEALGCAHPQDEEIHMALARLLEESKGVIRRSAVEALGRIKPQDKNVHLLISEILLKDPDSDVRFSAAHTLGKIKSRDREVHMALVRALKDSDLNVRRSASWALLEIKPQDKNVHLLISEILLKDPNSSVRANAALVLREIKPQDQEIHMALARALKDSDSGVRNSAAWALGEIKSQDREIHMALARALKDVEMAVRRFAAEALGRIKPQDEEVRALIREAGYGNIL